MKMRFLAILFIAISLLGCKKPNPTPELADDIYLDLNTRAQSAQKELDSEKKKLEGFKKELAAVVPQTGAIKYAQKRYFESEAKIQKLVQEVKYYELKAAARKKYTKLEYMKAFNEGKSWPLPEEVDAYKTYKTVSVVPHSWNSKKRVESYEKEFGTATSASKEPPKTEKAAKTESGGH
ncbi:hypothetical protein [Bdellovibrio sp. HCB337]|uniref:hypothetical protein n=1 Tax=Bdellovibrio sp. HCB337 TaxID=3394358 RepID=UPI0039A431F7